MRRSGDWKSVRRSRRQRCGIHLPRFSSRHTTVSVPSVQGCWDRQSLGGVRLLCLCWSRHGQQRISRFACALSSCAELLMQIAQNRVRLYSMQFHAKCAAVPNGAVRLKMEFVAAESVDFFARWSMMFSLGGRETDVGCAVLEFPSKISCSSEKGFVRLGYCCCCCWLPRVADIIIVIIIIIISSSSFFVSSSSPVQRGQNVINTDSTTKL